VQDPGENVDDSIAVVIAVAIIEFLEVIEVRVADREFLVRLQPAPDLTLDFGSPREPRGWVNRDVTFGPDQHGIHAGSLLRRREQSGEDLVRPRCEPGLHLLRMMGAGQSGYRHDGRKGIALKPPDQPHPNRSGVVPIHEEQTGVTPQHDGFDVVWLTEYEEGERMGGGPLADQCRHRTAIRRKEENRRTRPHLLPLVRSYV
jgi:hypothetical protein